MRRFGLTILVFGFTMLSFTAWAQTPLSFVAINPCRVFDTRLPNGPFGGPSITGGTTRTFNPEASTTCAIPSTADAYAFNVTVVPTGNYLGYLTVWPSSLQRPVVSTLNSFDGRIKADAVIVGSGVGGGVSFYATDTTDVVVDITGYFVSPNVAGGLVFVPLVPCNMVDTTQPKGPLAGPSLTGFTARSFPVSTSSCVTGLPAEAYSLNITAIPKTTLGYLTVWNSDFTQPVVSTLNAPTGAVTSNAALIVAASGSISAFPSDAMDLMIDVNGVFVDPHSMSGLSLYTMVPCRALDTRTVGAGKPVVGVANVDIVGSGCVASAPQAYVTNATVVPTTTLAFLDLFDPSLGVPAVETLHALDAAVTSNMSIVTGNCGWFGCTGNPDGSVDYDASSPTAVIVDVNAYFDFSTLRITNTSLPAAIDTIPYTVQLNGQGGVPPYAWTQTGLPTGLTLSKTTGVISGTTTAAPGSYPVVVTLTDSAMTAVVDTFTLNVSPLTALSI